MEPSKEVTRVGGYIYGPKTRHGFLRMARLGIPRPPFALEKKIAETLKRHFKEQIKDMVVEFIQEGRKLLQARRGDVLVSDGIEDDIPGWGDMDQANRQEIINSIHAALASRWYLEAVQLDPEIAREWFEKVLAADASDFYKHFLQDAGGAMKGKLAAISIDKRLIFTEDIAEEMRKFIEDGRQRVSWENWDLKQAFLKALENYVTGKSDTFSMRDVVNKLGKQAMRKGRFFARDQMARFNKALTLTTFRNAGVTKVKWMTCGDSRVRESHRLLNGKIFPIDAIPEEKDDYNCRCGLIPVEYEDD